MAKFFLTNSKVYYNAIKGHIQKTAFQLSFDYVEKFVCAIAVHKLGMQNENAVKKDNDFCIATGTCIYKESLNYEELLRTFRGNVEKTRQEIIGQYAICVRKGDSITIFGDACNCYDIFYWQEGKEYIISNSLYEIAYALQGKVSINPVAIVERSLQRVLLNGETIFNEIRCIQVREYIVVNVEKNELCIKHSDVIFPIETDFDKAVQLSSDTLRENARIAANVLGQPTVCVTGGLDSRLLLAAYLSAGIKPRLLYGEGHFHGQPSDEKIAKMYAERLGLELVIGDMTLPDPIDRNWDDYINNHGFATAGMWGASGNIIRTLDEQSTQSLNFGWGGELYRDTNGWFNQIESGQSFDCKEYFDNYYNHSPSLDAVTHIFPDYKDIVLGHLEKECHYLKLNPAKLGIDDSFVMDVVYEGKAETQVPAFMQQRKYCYLLEFEYNVLQNRVPFEMKRNAKFQLSMIKALYAELLDIPIFSCCQWRKYDPESMTMHLYQPIDELGQLKSYAFISAISPEFIKRCVLRPVKRIISQKLNPRGKREDFFIPKENLNDYKMEIDFPFNELSKEDNLIYALIIRTLKKLHY